MFNPQVIRLWQQGLLVGVTGARRGGEEGGERGSRGGQGRVGAASQLGLARNAARAELGAKPEMMNAGGESGVCMHVSVSLSLTWPPSVHPAPA